MTWFIIINVLILIAIVRGIFAFLRLRTLKELAHKDKETIAKEVARMSNDERRAFDRIMAVREIALTPHVLIHEKAIISYNFRHADGDHLPTEELYKEGDEKLIQILTTHPDADLESIAENFGIKVLSIHKKSENTKKTADNKPDHDIDLEIEE